MDHADWLQLLACVSAELISGKAYVFDRGSLSEAMRATMSIPGVFGPAREGDKVLVDGGQLDNLPTDVVRNMGADVVIAIHLQISKASARDIPSALQCWAAPWNSLLPRPNCAAWPGPT